MVSAGSLHMAGLHPGLIIPVDEHGLLSGIYTFAWLHAFLFVSLCVPAAGASPSRLGFPPPAQATFVGGFVVGFATLWQLSLVILAIVPVLAVAGGVYAVVLTGLVAKGQQAYSGAGGVAEQMISAVRTVRAPGPWEPRQSTDPLSGPLEQQSRTVMAASCLLAPCSAGPSASGGKLAHPSAVPLSPSTAPLVGMPSSSNPLSI